MNAWNRQQLEEDDSGLLESCDCCNALIFNFDWLEMAHLMEDGDIFCKICFKGVESN
jgi:hypothetical protein